MQNQKKPIQTITICGSMRFQQEMIAIAQDLELKQNLCVIQCIYNLEQVSPRDHARLAQLHEKKIAIADAIYVVNIGGYIGESTRHEIATALRLQKEVIYHEPIGKDNEITEGEKHEK